MTIVTNQTNLEFDENPEFEAQDRAQPIAVEYATHFVILEQWDQTSDMKHCIIVEYKDVPALIETLEKSIAGPF